MTSPMPPTGTYAGGAMTPATGGKAPATATGGYLQVGGDKGALGDRQAPSSTSLLACLPAASSATACLKLCSLTSCPSPPALPPSLPSPHLQVSSLQVYDELLESALKAVGCGPRNLALHGPWVWLLDRFCDSYSVGRNYARLSYLKWVVRPENATLTADCFDVLLRDMVALQQAAAVDGLSSGELGVQAQVGG